MNVNRPETWNHIQSSSNSENYKRCTASKKPTRKIENLCSRCTNYCKLFSRKVQRLKNECNKNLSLACELHVYFMITSLCSLKMRIEMKWMTKCYRRIICRIWLRIMMIFSYQLQSKWILQETWWSRRS